MKIWALHGFLGWSQDFLSLQEKMSGLSWQGVDYLKNSDLSSAVSLADWGQKFNSWVQRENASKEDSILLGYSQGGRLALQALSAQPKLWKAAVLISTNWGLKTEQRAARLERDSVWAQRFLTQNFNEVVADWNQQRVFHGSQNEPQRLAEDYDPRQLAQCLTDWSVARQQNFQDFLRSPPMPILNVIGERDSQYVEKFGEGSVIIKKSGHRILFDQPDSLAQEIQTFITGLAEESARPV